MARRHDLIIIGGGVGGLVTASVAGQLGLDVVMVERAPRLGGDCLHYGCVPSKTLIRSAGVAHLARQGRQFGLDVGLERVDLGRVMDRVAEVVARIQQHDDPQRFRDYGVDVRFGEARFVDRHTVEVDGEPLQARRFVIATGSGPALPDVDGLAAVGYLTNESVFAERALPRRLLVLGAGPVGVELSQAFGRLGSEVTLIDMGDQILPRDDAELTVELTGLLEREGIRVHLGTEAVRAFPGRDGTKAVEARLGSETLTFEADEILVATGRRANTEGLNLEAVGVELTESGTIRVDSRLRTSTRHIFACGDCAGPFPFTHVAEYQAGVIIANVAFRLPRRVDYRAVPWVTYTDPELAHVGLTAVEAAQRNLAVEVARFRFRDVDRALAEGSEDGLVKLVVHRGRIIGGSILGPHAGELIQEVSLAIEARLPLRRLASAVHAYPTLAQIIKRAAGSLYAPRLFSARSRRLVGALNRVLP